MEKLKPILNQKFWILAALAILLPIYPWMTTLGTMQDDFKAKETQIKDAFNKVPKEKPLANQKWIDPVKKQTKEEEVDFVTTKKILWDNHKALMKWPQGTLDIEKGMRDGSVRFWGEIPVAVLRSYKQDFPVLKLELYKRLKAFPPAAQILTAAAPGAPGFPPGAPPAIAPPAVPATKPAEVKKGEELIAFPFEDLPLRPLDKAAIDLTSQQVWETQEDFWLLQSIFTALDNVNQDQAIPAQTQADAVIKQLYKVELMGGGKSRLAGPSGDGAGAAPSTTGTMGGDKVNFSFNPSEEFGPLTGKADKALASSGLGAANAAAAAAAKPGATPPATTPPPAVAAPPKAPAAASVASSPSMSVPANQDRYIDKNPALAQRTRGFYIELLMDHRKLPQLLTELRNSPWTTRVVRVQVVARENGTSPSGPAYGGPLGLASSAPGSTAPTMGLGATFGGNFGGFGAGAADSEASRAAAAAPVRRSRRDDGDGPVTPDTTAANAAAAAQAAALEAGPLGDPMLAYVAICGVITIYLPPPEAGNAILAVVPAVGETPAPPATVTPPLSAAPGVAAQAKSTPQPPAAPPGNPPLPAGNAVAPPATAPPQKK